MEGLATANYIIFWNVFVDMLFIGVPGLFLIGLVANLR